jgi:hypothetical protein
VRFKIRVGTFLKSQDGAVRRAPSTAASPVTAILPLQGLAVNAFHTRLQTLIPADRATTDDLRRPGDGWKKHDVVDGGLTEHTGIPDRSIACLIEECTR